LRRCLTLVALLAALAASPAALSQPTTTELMPAVTYSQEVRTIGGETVVLHVVVAPKPGGLYRLAPVLSEGDVTGRATLTEMQKPLAGSATVVGVNGDLFNWKLGYPTGLVMHEGLLAARPVSTRSSLAIGVDGLLRIARVGFFGRWALADGERRPLAQFNRPLEGNGVALFTSTWGSVTPVSKKAVDIVIDTFPKASVGTDLVGQVASVSEGGGTEIPREGAVVQAVGPLANELLSSAVPGSSFLVRLNLRPWWDDVADAIGGGPALIQDGKVVLPTSEHFTPSQLQPRAPRTAVGQLEDGRIVFVAVDGRSAASAGVDLRQLAEELVRLGVVNGMALDAGGSTELAFDGHVLNTPSDGQERALSNSLMVFYFGVYAAPPSEPVVSPNGDGAAETEQVSFKIVKASTVEARLVGPGGHVFYKDESPKEPGTYPFEVAKDVLKEGTWRWVVRATDQDGNKSKAERSFTVNNTLGFLELSKRALKVTKKRGATVGISFRVASRARVSVTIENQLGLVVRTLESRVLRKPGEVALSWDARSEPGAVVAPGAYTVSISATNNLGPVELSARVTVKRRK
jgi:Phosphodiester glycosidase/FlgD Ig-like domain